MVGIQAFPIGFRPIFRCELLVSGRVVDYSGQIMSTPHTVPSPQIQPAETPNFPTSQVSSTGKAIKDKRLW